MSISWQHKLTMPRAVRVCEAHVCTNTAKVRPSGIKVGLFRGHRCNSGTTRSISLLLAETNFISSANSKLNTWCLCRRSNALRLSLHCSAVQQVFRHLHLLASLPRNTFSTEQATLLSYLLIHLYTCPSFVLLCTYSMPSCLSTWRIQPHDITGEYLQCCPLSYSPSYSPCAASLSGIPPGGLGLRELVHEKAHPSMSKFV